MSTKRNWDERYESGNTPWDTGRPDSNLVRLVGEHPIEACRTLEVGCGTGSNAVWLAGRGFDVTATELSNRAIEMASERAREAGVSCRIHAVDLLSTDVPGGPFAFAFDRGCFHSYREHAEREHFARRLAGHLAAGGLWLSLCGRPEDAPPEPGPPRVHASAIVDAVESSFEVVSLLPGRFDREGPDAPAAWVCLFRRK
jgi:SAM-dependent methyltransferase